MTLKYTADQIRDRQSAQIGKGSIPNKWWGFSNGSDCMAAQAWILGFRTRAKSSTPYEISIAAFRAHFGWDEVPMSQARAGMLVAQYWPSAGGPRTSRVPNHIEYIHTVNHDAGTITTDSANTGPQPGVAHPRNFYRKTRPITDNMLFAIVVPAKGDDDTSPYGAGQPKALSRKNVKLIAAFLNERIDGTHTGSDKDGIAGPNYWTLVQTWGRKNNIYGPGFHIDGIPGPRTRNVEAVILKRAIAAKK